MAGNFRASAGIETPGRTAVQGSYVPVRQAPVQVQAQVPAQAPQAAYGLAYQMGGPNYMYGVTPRFGAYYRDGGMPPGQIHGNMPGSREGADMFGFWPTMFQSSPYATASQMYTPGLGVMPLIGYPSRYPHVIMGGYTDYGAGIGNQAMGMMLPLLMMGLYRQMFPMPGMPGAAGAAGGAGGAGGRGGSGGGGGKSGGSGGGTPVQKGEAPLPDGRNGHYQNLEEALAQPDSRRVYDYQGFDPDYAMRGVSRRAASSAPAPAPASAVLQSTALRRGLNVANTLLNPAAAAGVAMTPYAEAAGRWALDHPVERRVIETAMPGIGPAVAATDASWSALSDYIRGK